MRWVVVAALVVSCGVGLADELPEDTDQLKTLTVEQAEVLAKHQGSLRSVRVPDVGVLPSQSTFVKDVTPSLKVNFIVAPVFPTNVTSRGPVTLQRVPAQFW